MLDLNSRTELVGLQPGLSHKQHRRLMIALSLLLVALAVVLVKNREFWFGSEEAVESDAAYPENVSKTDSPSAAAQTHQTPVTQVASKESRRTPRTSTMQAVPASYQGAAEPSPVVTTNRAVLPPLDVEVVAGDTHRIIRSGSNIAKVEILGDSNRSSVVTMSGTSPVINAAEHEPLSPEGVPELRQSIDSTYPLLGQHMRVQGSVVLQAVVGTDGAIEDLRVLSGPSILTAAAQQAVRQWRFKPYFQNGQPVETKAKITVNFSIRISDNPASTS